MAFVMELDLPDMKRRPDWSSNRDGVAYGVGDVGAAGPEQPS